MRSIGEEEPECARPLASQNRLDVFAHHLGICRRLRRLAGLEVVADKGYHSDETLVGLGEVGVRSHVSEPERGRRCWQDKKTGETPPEKRAVPSIDGRSSTCPRIPWYAIR